MSVYDAIGAHWIFVWALGFFVLGFAWSYVQYLGAKFGFITHVSYFLLILIWPITLPIVASKMLIDATLAEMGKDPYLDD